MPKVAEDSKLLGAIGTKKWLQKFCIRISLWWMAERYHVKLNYLSVKMMYMIDTAHL